MMQKLIDLLKQETYVERSKVRTDNAHYKNGRFFVPDTRYSLPGLNALFKWQFSRRLSPDEYVLEQNKAHEVPWQPVDVQQLNIWQEQGLNTVTWLGHVNMLLRTQGHTMIIDPVFSERCSPFDNMGPRRFNANPIQLHELPTIHTVLITHNHYDHLDEPSIHALEQAHHPLYIVPLGLASFFTNRGIAAQRVVELDWWQSYPLTSTEHSDITHIYFTPAQHWSKRTAFDTNKSLWGGFYIKNTVFSFYFTGDTGYSDWFDGVLQHVKQDLGAPHIAALPIGAYEPRSFMQFQHANPDDACRMWHTLQPHTAFGVHWGVFKLTDESVQRPMYDLMKARQAHQLTEDEFKLLAIGDTLLWMNADE